MAWGIPANPQNRWSVMLLLGLSRRRPDSGRLQKRARRFLHRRLCLMLTTDFRTASFGDRLYLPHPYGIVIHAATVIGDRCTIYQHVTLGEDNSRPGAPTIGDDVVIGAGAAVLGSVRVGNGARVGANAVVIADVPDGAVAVGVPARTVGRAPTGPRPRSSV